MKLNITAVWPALLADEIILGCSSFTKILKTTPLKQQSQQIDKEDHKIEYNVKKWQRLQYAHNNKEINVGRDWDRRRRGRGLRQWMTPMRAYAHDMNIVWKSVDWSVQDRCWGLITNLVQQKQQKGREWKYGLINAYVFEERMICQSISTKSSFRFSFLSNVCSFVLLWLLVCFFYFTLLEKVVCTTNNKSYVF